MASLKKGLIGSVLLVFQSVMAKSIGLISTLILARVLVPDDFGLVAMANIFMGMVQILTSTGGGEYILRAKNVNDTMLNTNWTITFLIKCFIAIITLISAPFVADYFSEPRIIEILYVTSAITIIGGLESPGIHLLRREQNYKPLVMMELCGKSFAVATAVTIALVYESFWALVLGQAVTVITRTIGTYFITSFRPNFSLKNINDQFAFSSWRVGQSLFGYARTQMDSFLVASNFSQNQLGQYNVMKYIAFLPNMLLLGPATEPLLRQLSAISDSGSYFNRRLNVATMTGMSLALLIALIININASLIVELFLGAQWLEYSHLFAMFAYLIPAYLLFHMANRIFVVFNNTKTVFFYEIGSFSLIFIALISIGVESLEVFTLVRVSLEMGLSFLFLIFAYIKYTKIQNTLRLLMLLLPIIVSSVVTYYATDKFTWRYDNVFIDIAASSLLLSTVFVLVNMFFLFALRAKVEEYRILDQYKNKMLQKVFKMKKQNVII